ncbi:DUF5694 domain-containing protein [bacterium]|nr:DUF5694 domain-containing protein [bacterium]MDB0037777.1 DUF5694 domain-containing protein [bacterium]
MKIYHLFLAILLTAFSSCGESNEKKSPDTETEKLQVLLIGGSHWDNYEQAILDEAQTNEVDILSERYQTELEQITQKIAEFNPDKIFVERTLDFQPKLDSLYELYKSSDWGDTQRNEIYQLGFRAASKLNHIQVYGVDYTNTTTQCDSLMYAKEIANQKSLNNTFKLNFGEYESLYRFLIKDKKPLMDIFAFLNNPEQRKLDIDWYLSGANSAGAPYNETGSFFASEWIKRNVYTYGLIQKYVDESDKRIMILMGASHVAMLEHLMESNSTWETVELEAIMNK